MTRKCAILFSGGTDSMCAVSIIAKDFDEFFLVTFTDYSTKRQPSPVENVEKLRRFFKDKIIHHVLIPVDNLIRFFSYYRYLKFIRQFGLMNFSMPAFSSLSWHTRMIRFCMDNDINHAADGMTREMMQLPGHMKEVQEVIKDFYSKYKITFSSPVLEWPVPEEQELMDRIVVNQHGFMFEHESKAIVSGTTGDHLFKLGIFPHPNIKGSLFDKQMQHDCYNFILYNIYVYWYFLVFRSMDKLRTQMSLMFQKKIECITPYLSKVDSSDNSQLFEDPLT